MSGDMRGSGSPRVHVEGEDFASRLAALAEPAQETQTVRDHFRVSLCF